MANPLIGLPIGQSLTLLSADRVLNKTTGAVVPTSTVAPGLVTGLVGGFQNQIARAQAFESSPVFKAVPVTALPAPVPYTIQPPPKPPSLVSPSPPPLPPPSPPPVRVSPPRPVEIKTEVEVVSSVDSKIINLYLKTADGVQESDKGFLVEVYLSGTDGRLTRVYKEDVVDVLNDDVLSEGFSNYLVLEVDK